MTSREFKITCVTDIIFLLDRAGPGNSSFAMSIFDDYIQTKGIFCIIGSLPITGKGLSNLMLCNILRCSPIPIKKEEVTIGTATPHCIY